MTKDLTGITDLSAEEIKHLLSLASDLKRQQKSGGHEPFLKGQVLALIFEKPSLRTRVSFEVGMFQLGGSSIYLSPSDIKMKGRETVADIARNLERFTQGIMARVFDHQDILELAKFAKIPVINGLSDLEHPCQTLADLLTIQEHKGKLKGTTVTFMGDGNNVAISLALGCALVGANFHIATPIDFEIPANLVKEIETRAKKSGSTTLFTHDPAEAAKGSDVLYTDVWTSMGQEEETEKRKQVFPPYQINTALLQQAKPDCIVMHCLPAHREEEITHEVIEGPQSVVFDQAENRLHAQKAVLVTLMGRAT